VDRPYPSPGATNRSPKSSVELRAKAEVAEAELMETCPRCKRMDAVAKVSGIVSAGTKDRFDSGVQVRPPLATGGGEWSVDLTRRRPPSGPTWPRRRAFPGELGYGAGVLLALSLTAAFIAIAAFVHLAVMSTP
jgi:hypothetical protein